MQANMRECMGELERAMAAAYEAWRADGERRGKPLAEPEVDPRIDAVWDSWTRSGVPRGLVEIAPYDHAVGWTYIWGPVGSGKTTGACRMLRRFVEDGCRELIPGLWSRPRAKFTTAQRYLSDIRASWQTPEMDRALVARGCDCLVLDDLGQEPPTEWAVAQIFDLIDHRYSENLPTIVTSQYPLSDMEGRLALNGGGEQARALVSRLAGSCHKIRLDHEDRRVA